MEDFQIDPRVEKVEEIPPKTGKSTSRISASVRVLFGEFLESNKDKFTVRIKEAKNAVSALLGGILKACWLEMGRHNPGIALLTRVEVRGKDLYLEFKKRT